MKVFVGMSGGVDSSVTAAMLQKQGHDVVGVFIKGWYPEGIPCTWKEDRLDAMRVAVHLGIPFTTLDLANEYKQSVIDYLIAEYRAGRTPNPDVLCNKDIKFGAFFKWARAHGADKIATGHYAQVFQKKSYTALLRSVDEKKDQSYFMYTLTQEQLPHILFPLGAFSNKAETRKKAEAFKLPVAKKPDSQGLCFIGHVDMDSFLSRYIQTVPGQVLDINGTVIGEHQGAILYTLGQRQGFTITTAQDGPLYVLKKDIDANTITVGTEDAQEAQASRILHIENSTWTHEIKDTNDLHGQYRYHGPKIPIQNIASDGTVTFTESLPEVPAAGQALVIYRGEECLGGGTIVY